MATERKIMAWSQCTIEYGKTGAAGAFASSLTSFGTVKDRSATLTAEDGEVLEAKMTGGISVAREVQDGTFILAFRIIEPEASLLKALGIAKDGSSESGTTGETVITTHIVEGEYSIKVTPKNTGAKGIKAPTCNLSYKPGWSEEEGNYADIEVSILFNEEKDYWYSIFAKTAPAE